MGWRSTLALVALSACSLVDSVDDYAGEPAGSGGDGTDAGPDGSIGGDAGVGFDANDAGWPGCGTGAKLCGNQCVSLDDPAHGCGALDCAPCALSQAKAVCAAGGCSISQCSGGFANCDSQDGNGCETALGTDQDCAACGQTCNAPSGSATCSEGSCKITSCPANTADCDGLVENGCESDLTTTGTCGGCGVKCKAGFICNATTSGYLCACLTPAVCGNGGECFYGICVCGGNGCGIGQSCVAPGQCG